MHRCGGGRVGSSGIIKTLQNPSFRQKTDFLVGRASRVPRFGGFCIFFYKTGAVGRNFTRQSFENLGGRTGDLLLTMRVCRNVSPRADLNCGPTPYHGVALPTELRGHEGGKLPRLR